jgi:multicomponent Na+:H+ antiporter subunit B
LNWHSWTVLALFLGLLVYAESDLPDPRDASAPTRTHIVPQYIERSYPETHTPNIVTAVLADYRGYDTLGETVVILTAGLAVILILPRNDRRR